MGERAAFFALDVRLGMGVSAKERIERYIEDVIAFLERFPAERRHEELMKLRPQIERDLSLTGRGGDGQFVMDTIRARLTAASRPRRPGATYRGPRLSGEDAHWLGVCAGLAEYLGLNPPWVRGAFFLAGFLAGPFALMGYIVLFGVMRHRADQAVDIPVDLTKAGLKVGKVVLLAFTIFVMAQAIVAVLGYVVAYFTSHPQDIQALGWFPSSHGRLFVWLLVTVLPLAVLGALPLANDWDSTLTKVSYALVALYSLVVCFGLAGTFVSALMHLLQLAPSIDGLLTSPE